MSAKLPKTVQTYVEAYNARNHEAAAACFSENALVHDEGKDYRGRKAIGAWIGETIGKYQPLLAPVDFEEKGKETVVSMTVSGQFPGSPVELAFHFTFDSGRITSLRITPLEP